MRAAAILGLGTSPTNLTPFQKDPNVAWRLGLPAHSSDADAVLIFGGDGTIHRHLSQLVELRLPVLIVPCGSGNDFAHSLELRNTRDALTAWRKFSAEQKNKRNIDLGLITPHGEASPSHYFCCAGGIGLDGEIAKIANALPRWLRSHGGYALSLPLALARFSPPLLRITQELSKDAPKDPPNSRTPDQRVVTAVFANTPVYGGGMKIAPRAKLDDGQLDLCIIPSMNKLKLLTLFPTIYSGRHLNIPSVEYFLVTSLTLTTDELQSVYADGEYICQTPISVSVAPGALSVIVP